MHNPHIIRRIKYRFNLYKSQKKSHNLHKIILVFILIISVSLFSLFTIEKRLFSLAERLAFSHLQNEISRECNILIKEILNENQINLSEILSSNTTNDISSLSADYTELNFLKAEISDKMTEYMKGFSYVECEIPSGSLISDSIFAGYGFKIPVRLIASGTANTDFYDEFISSGINNTKYSLSIKVTVNIELQSVFKDKITVFDTYIPLTEKIIIGDVPNYIYGQK